MWKLGRLEMACWGDAGLSGADLLVSRSSPSKEFFSP
jgi:hypothetical protein